MLRDNWHNWRSALKKWNSHINFISLNISSYAFLKSQVAALLANQMLYQSRGCLCCTGNPLQQTFDSISQVRVYRVPMDCPKLHNAKVMACAELPDNWKWILKNGVVVMDLFNQPKVDNVSL